MIPRDVIMITWASKSPKWPGSQKIICKETQYFSFQNKMSTLISCKLGKREKPYLPQLIIFVWKTFQVHILHSDKTAFQRKREVEGSQVNLRPLEQFNKWDRNINKCWIPNLFQLTTNKKWPLLMALEVASLSKIRNKLIIHIWCLHRF